MTINSVIWLLNILDFHFHRINTTSINESRLHFLMISYHIASYNLITFLLMVGVAVVV